jgi:hypothetical protein
MSHTVESPEKIRQRNTELLDAYHYGDDQQVKKASASLDGFVRTKLREDCVMDDVIPPIPAKDSDLEQRIHDDNPSMIFDIEPDSPAAVTVGFGTQPTNVTPYGKRYRINFRRILTKRFVTDVARMRNYRYDIREVVTDNAVRDMYAEKDSKWFATVERTLGGASGAVVAASGITQWRDIPGGVTPPNIYTMRAQLEETPGRWPVTKVVCNHLFRYQVMKNSPGQVGDDLVDEWIRTGKTSSDLFGVTWRSSIKRDIIPDNRCYLFTKTENLGHHVAFEEVTMSVKRENYMILWFAYGSWGAGIANVFGAGISDYV